MASAAPGAGDTRTGGDAAGGAGVDKARSEVEKATSGFVSHEPPIVPLPTGPAMGPRVGAFLI